MLDSSLRDYDRVKDEANPGWACESNIYFNSAIFNLKDHGFGDLGMQDHPHRGLFWGRLVLKQNPRISVFVSTAHFPWVGCTQEIETGQNQRIPAALKVCAHLRRLIPPGEPVIFAGDFNDDFHPLRILNEEFGMTDVFEALDLPPQVTHPVRPSSFQEEMRPNRTLDWITSNLPHNCRVIGAFVKSIRGGRFPPPSDHLPVVAFFELGQPDESGDA